MRDLRGNLEGLDHGFRFHRLFRFVSLFDLLRLHRLVGFPQTKRLEQLEQMGKACEYSEPEWPTESDQNAGYQCEKEPLRQFGSDFPLRQFGSGFVRVV